MSEDERIEPGGLARRWRREAEVLRRRGAPGPAEALETAADDLEARWKAWAMETLTVAEAAEEFGVAPKTVYDWIERGHVRDLGGEGVARVRRREVLAHRAGASWRRPRFG